MNRGQFEGTSHIFNFLQALRSNAKLQIIKQALIFITAFQTILLQAQAEDVLKICNAFLETKIQANSIFNTHFFNDVHNTNYDVEISTPPIKAQCQTGHCHLYTWTSQLEHVSGIQLSNDYLDAMHLYHMAIEAFKLGRLEVKVGSVDFESRDFILKYGLIPEHAWTPIYPPKSPRVHSKITAGLESIILNARAKQMDAEATSELMLKFIQSVVGVWPANFEYSGQNYTPESFKQAYLPNLKMRTHHVTYSSRGPKDAVEFKSYTYPKTVHTQTMAGLENMLMNVLDRGLPAYLSYNHHVQFVDYETGVMSIDAFNFPPEAIISERDTLSENGLYKNSHAVLVVGYQKDSATGRPIKWKIKNSWGTTAGDSGYFHMYSDYFQLHAWSFSFVEDN